MDAIDVVAMGNAIVDVLVPVDDDFLLQHKIAKGVMTLIDEVRAQQLYQAFPGGRKEVAGGSAANTMAGLISLGGSGQFIGKVRDDRLGAAFDVSMKETGIHFTTAPAGDGPTTACCLIAVAPDGQRSMNTFLGASRGLKPADILKDDIAAAKILYIEGYLWDVDAAIEAAKKAIAFAHDHNTKVAFTLSDPFCVGRFREDFLELIKNDVDIVFANEEEAKALFGANDFNEALQQFSNWDGIAALTRGAKGCVVSGRGETHVLDAVPVKTVLDTTGAGDAFAAGFLYGLTHDKPLSACGKFGSLASSEIISHYGARPLKPLKDLAAEAGLL